MKKLFEVTKDMDNMSMDQLKGAVRNMETLSNAMYVVMEELLNEHESNPGCINVLTVTTKYWSDGIKEMFLPSTDGGTVIIPTNRLDSLLRWKLQFFSKYGNLNLSGSFNGENSVHLTAEEWNNRDQDGFSTFSEDRRERERSNAALYESMSNSKKF